MMVPQRWERAYGRAKAILQKKMARSAVEPNQATRRLDLQLHCTFTAARGIHIAGFVPQHRPANVVRLQQPLAGNPPRFNLHGSFSGIAKSLAKAKISSVRSK
jgi:hypothetical protein